VWTATPGTQLSVPAEWGVGRVVTLDGSEASLSSNDLSLESLPVLLVK
jgi:hypothetical protein